MGCDAMLVFTTTKYFFWSATGRWWGVMGDDGGDFVAWHYVPHVVTRTRKKKWLFLNFCFIFVFAFTIMLVRFVVCVELAYETEKALWVSFVLFCWTVGWIVDCVRQTKTVNPLESKHCWEKIYWSVVGSDWLYCVYHYCLSDSLVHPKGWLRFVFSNRPTAKAKACNFRLSFYCNVTSSHTN